MPLRITNLVSAAPSLVAALLCGTAAAQEAPLAPVLPNAVASQNAQAVDESALRYYAEHNEADYFSAEVRRLRALYPDWTPPADMASLSAADDPEAALWAYFAKGDWAGLDKAASDLKAARPAWTMSADLAAKIADAKARGTLLAASDAGDWAQVQRLATEHPALGGCADLEAAWRIAAAEAESGDQASALDAYRTLLTACTEPAGRKATVEKALATLGPTAAHPLLALGHADASGGAEFAELANAFTRAEIAAKLADPAAPEPPADAVATLAAAALYTSAADAQLLGWFFRAEGNHVGALKAFEAASTLLGPGGDPAERGKIVEGIVLSLADGNRRAEAIDLARSNWKLSPDLAKTYVSLAAERFEGNPRPRLPDGEIADYAAAVGAAQSPAGAEAIGWYAFDFRQWSAAALWFDTALAWNGENAGRSGEGAARGAVLTATARGDSDGAKAVLARWEGNFPGMAQDIRTLMQAPPPKPAGKAAVRRGGGNGDPLAVRFQRRDFAGCVALGRKLGHLTAEQSETLGWCLLKLNRPSEAAESFAAAASGAARTSNRRNAVYGRSLALFASGDPRGAAELAGSEPMTSERRNEIGVAVLADQAIAAFNREGWAESLKFLDERRRFARETMDLTRMRGWALYHLNRKAEAAKIFRQMDRTLSTPETRRALAQLGRTGTATD